MISLQHVTKCYEGHPDPVVADLSLEVGTGELLVLLGPSGCGKTTTLKMINRLEDPTSGHIFINNEPIDELNPVLLRRHTGYVIQGAALFPHMTVAENIGVVPQLCGWPSAQIQSRVEELLSLVMLPFAQFGDRFPAELSGGQAQRVGLARALAASPGIMLMDEPFGALDPITRDELQQEFLRIHNSSGLTTVMVTHDVLEALLVADKIAVMQAGRVVCMGTPAELINQTQNSFVSELMKMPYSQAERVEALLRPGDQLPSGNLHD